MPRGYVLVRSGNYLGAAAPPANSSYFSTLDSFQAQGPVVNLLGSWSLGGLDAVASVHAAGSGARDAVHDALETGAAPDEYYGQPAAPGGRVAAGPAGCSAGGVARGEVEA